MARVRTPEDVERDIQREREQLALAVSSLRGELKSAADVGARIRSRLPRLAAVFLLAAGAFAALRLGRRRRRSREHAHLGRFRVVERG